MAVKSQLLGISLLVLLLAALPGCRKTLSPEIGRTHAPEAWVTIGHNGASSATAKHPWELEAEAIGDIVTLAGDGSPVLLRRQVFPLTPVTMIAGWPKDTVPVGSHLSLKWRPVTGPTGMMGASAAAARSGNEEGTPVSAAGGANPDTALTPGVKTITVQAPHGGGTANLYFMVNFNPEHWWAGPDPAAWPISAGERSVAVSDWTHFTTTPPWPPDGRAYFGPDSFRFIPSVRLPVRGDVSRRTFYEIYGDRIYARAEGDTVHMNSWVVLVNGGYDKDSKYVPRVDSADPALPPGYASDPVRYAVLNDLGLVGSPIGFRMNLPMRLTPAGMISRPAQTSMYPDYRPSSVFRAPHLAGYWAMNRAGKAYALPRAEDSDGGLDTKLADPVDLVDNGQGTPTENALRRKVLTFYVDKPPALVRSDPTFRPIEGQTIETCLMSFRLVGTDPDPFYLRGDLPPPGGPTAQMTIRFSVTLYGKNPAGRDTSWSYLNSDGTPFLHFPIADVMFKPGGTTGNPFATGDLKVSIQICDCDYCEELPGSGRCVEGIQPLTKQVVNPQNVITVHYVRPPGCD